jgi:hypothetical protein
MPEQPAGEAAALGTMLHELSEKILRGEEIDNPDLDPDHLKMAQSYADYVNGISANPRKKLIEVNVDAGLKSLHQALGGTADAVIVDGNHLHIVDAKFGRVLVEAENNKQLLTYALGVMRQFNAPSTIQCTMHIYQPRAGHSKWTVSGETLQAHAVSLKAAAELALTGDAPTNPSPSACQYCRAKVICPSMRQKVQENARKEFAPSTAITPEMLDLATLASSWADAVQTAAKDQITKGSTITGWTMRQGRKTRFWKDEKIVMAIFKDTIQAWDLKSPSAISKLNIDVSEDLIGEKHAAASLVREKSKD